MSSTISSSTGPRFLFVITPVLLICLLSYASIPLPPLRYYRHFTFLNQTSSFAKSSHDLPQNLCLIYDKPPRTGSSTISNALRKCWMSYGYKFPVPTSKEFNITISKMLDLPGDRVGLAGVHFTMSSSELTKISLMCKHSYYVTSTRPMPERIASKAKFEVSGGKTYQNTTLSEDDLERAIQKAINDNTTEERLERYPFIDQKIEPDYIIRSQNFSEDLKALLRSFRCGEEFYTKNLHIVEEESSTKNVHISPMNKSETVHRQVQLKYGDHRHIYLSNLAQMKNEQTEKIRPFIEPLQ